MRLPVPCLLVTLFERIVLCRNIPGQTAGRGTPCCPHRPEAQYGSPPAYPPRFPVLRQSTNRIGMGTALLPALSGRMTIAGIIPRCFSQCPSSSIPPQTVNMPEASVWLRPIDVAIPAYIFRQVPACSRASIHSQHSEKRPPRCN